MKYFVLISFIFLTACVSTLNQRNAHNHAISGQIAQENGNWDDARRHWAKAVINARLADMNNKSLSIAYYEYGRSSGATCFFTESEKYLNLALDIDKKRNGPVHMSILELARLHASQSNLAKAVTYYEQLPAIYKERYYLEQRDPHGTGIVWEEYSEALSSLGKNEQAEQYHQKAIALKAKSSSSNSEITPYGQFCTNH
jgi:tetratricopeptide (TPR) repeat protein